MSAMSNVASPPSAYRSMASTAAAGSARPHDAPLTCHMPFTTRHTSSASPALLCTVVVLPSAAAAAHRSTKRRRGQHRRLDLAAGVSCGTRQPVAAAAAISLPGRARASGERIQEQEGYLCSLNPEAADKSFIQISSGTASVRVCVVQTSRSETECHVVQVRMATSVVEHCDHKHKNT